MKITIELTRDPADVRPQPQPDLLQRDKVLGPEAVRGMELAYVLRNFAEHVLRNGCPQEGQRDLRDSQGVAIGICKVQP